MSIPSGVRIADECISAVNDLRSKRGPTKPQFVIFKISDDQRTVIVEESSPEKDYEEFLQRISLAVEPNGDAAARYAVYDVEYSLGGDGKRVKSIFISWVPSQTSIKSRMIYASTREQLNKALNIGASIHADDLEDLEWSNVVREASGGKA
ncbi:cofilin, actophorin [Ilyonectria robusta]|uniref:cofilin, actophorin n=1 Tax=Ilyonectria robusta TaxID=1079257 RepID=UPI001E8EDB74|nr:cofilin, actophorin [Ilyonectria robusta]KAH8663754.1 cofilin, actophorin [Ilyonectria robusta]